MKKMERKIQQAGYQTVNVNYPSTRMPIEKLAGKCLAPAIRHCEAKHTEKIHFVTHSMGGILVRYYLQHHPLHNAGHIVMLSPPNKGSEIIDKLSKLSLFKWLNGPAALQLGTGKNSLPHRLGPLPHHAGIITGNRVNVLDIIPSRFIEGDSDGKVSIENAKLEGMKDFLVVPCSHTFIMNHDEVIEQTLHFLQYGSFHHGSGG